MIEKAVSTCVVSSRSRQEGVLVTCAERFWDPEVRDFLIWWVADWCRGGIFKNVQARHLNSSF